MPSTTVTFHVHAWAGRLTSSVAGGVVSAAVDATIPGDSMLEVCMFDYDDFGGDDLIGRTTIDLEDRWFEQRWRELGRDNE